MKQKYEKIISPLLITIKSFERSITLSQQYKNSFSQEIIEQMTDLKDIVKKLLSNEISYLTLQEKLERDNVTVNKMNNFKDIDCCCIQLKELWIIYSSNSISDTDKAVISELTFLLLTTLLEGIENTFNKLSIVNVENSLKVVLFSMSKLFKIVTVNIQCSVSIYIYPHISPYLFSYYTLSLSLLD